MDLELREQDMRDFELDEPARSSTARSGRCCTCRPGATAGACSSAWPRAPAGRAVCLEHLRVQPVHRGEAPRPSGCATASSDLWERVYVAGRQPDRRRGLEEAEDEPRLLSLWWVSRGEWEALIDVAGLEVEALYGWFDRRPFDEESLEFVWVTRKARLNRTCRHPGAGRLPPSGPSLARKSARMGDETVSKARRPGIEPVRLDCGAVRPLEPQRHRGHRLLRARLARGADRWSSSASARVGSRFRSPRRACR